MRLWMSIFLICISFCINAKDATSIHVNVDSQQFKVTLASNPSTGYQWTLKQYDKTVLKLLERYYVAPSTKLIGAGGEMIFVFGLVKKQHYPKHTKILFSYARPWESKAAQEKWIKVIFDAE